MITILRRLRKSLIESGSSRKYLLYAIGEIALVVIGILIALQINNWNEENKVRDKETEVLIGLQNNIESNIDFLDLSIKSLNSSNKSSEIIKQVVDGKLPFRDSLKWHFHNAHKRFGLTGKGLSFVGYESLKNAGFEIITNQSLRNEIHQLFEIQYSELINIDLKMGEYDAYNLEVKEGLFFMDRGSRLMPFNHDEVLNNNRYYAVLNRTRYNRGWVLNNCRKSQEESLKVLEFIKNELEVEN